MSKTRTTNLVSSCNEPLPAEQMRIERSHTDFDPLAMNEWLEGSVEKSQEILKMYQQLERDPILQGNPAHYDNGTHADRALVASRIHQMAKYLETDGITKFWRRLNLVTMYDPSLGIRISVNLALFGNCIRGNGTPSQVEYWYNYKEAGTLRGVYGCFGMTELGHGSNVAGCETTATFDEKTDEFVINTPNISATKWWIGGAAHSATHSVVYARLIVKGKDYGVKTFVVPLRDSKHDLLPGIAIGDIGAKMGRSGVDNGWIQFSDFRVPRFNMLQKWCKVDRDGTVTLPPLEQLSYISLLGGRVGMATDSYRICARFTTVALRYAIGRRQFKKNPKDEQECALIDYPLHQRRTIPWLALTYAMAVGTNRLEQTHAQILKDLDVAVAQNDKKLIHQLILDTKSLFVDSGSLKLTLTWLAADAIDQLRQTCGGQGYSSYSGFGKAYNDWVVQCTWEGDNNVLAMSAGKTIVNNVKQVLAGKPIDKRMSLAWLNDAKELIGSKAVLTSKADALDPAKVLQATKAVIARIAHTTGQRIAANGGDWDKLSFPRVKLSKLRCHAYLLETAIADFAKAEGALKKQLTRVIQQYCASSVLLPFASDFVINGVVANDVIAAVDGEIIEDLDTAIRPFVIGLTDSFQIPDNLINSFIGKYDGDIYANIHNGTKQLYPPIEGKPAYQAALELFLNRPTRDDRMRNEQGDYAREQLSK